MLSPQLQKCKAHPSQYLTNYCCSQQCYIELCATCVCEHTEVHNRNHTKPEYQNIKDTYAKTAEALNRYKDGLNLEKSKIKNVIDGIEKRRKQVAKSFKQAKEDVLVVVQRAFIDLQKQYNDQLNKQKLKSGLLNQKKLDELYSEINKKCLQAFSINQQLLSFKQNIIKRLNTDFLLKGQHFKKETAQQVAKNQLFQPLMTYRPDFLDEIAGSIKKLFQFSISYPVSGDFRPVKRLVSTEKSPIKQQRCIYTSTGLTKPTNFNSYNNTFVRSSSKSPQKFQVLSSNINKLNAIMRNTTKQNNFYAQANNTRNFAQTFN